MISLSSSAQTAVRSVDVGRTRWALLTTFLLFGLGTAAWMARLPAVRTRLDLSATELGTLLMAGAIGALIAVLAAGALVTRFGSVTMLVVGALTFAAGMGLMATGLAVTSAPWFIAGLFISGVSGPLSNVPINTNAAAVERAMSRSVMSQFHAAFSIGAVVGAGIGALCARLDISVSVQIVALTIFAVVLRLVLTPLSCALTRDDHRLPVQVLPDDSVAPTPPVTAQTGSEQPESVQPAPVEPAVAQSAPVQPARRASVRTAASAWRERRTLLIGVVVLAGSFSEGAASNWLAIAVVAGFLTTDATGALVLATFTCAMTVVRLLGPRFIDRWGRQRTIVISGVISIIGLAAFGFGPGLIVAWCGVIAWGCGAALSNPVAITAAADEPAHAAVRVSVATSFGSLAQIAAPPLLGFLVDLIGARHTLATIIVVMGVSIAAARALQPLHSTAAPARIRDTYDHR